MNLFNTLKFSQKDSIGDERTISLLNGNCAVLEVNFVDRIVINDSIFDNHYLLVNFYIILKEYV